jgi:hypothetical protein
MAPSLDYKDRCRPLYVNGWLVTALTMVGLAAEEALKVSKKRAVAVGGVTERDLPATLDVKLDRLGTRKVNCHEADRRRGVEVASAVRIKLHALGLEVSHVVLDVTDGKGGAPDPRHPTGPLSVELKCRHLYSDAGRTKVRNKLRKECGTECAWWLQAGAQVSIVFLACSKH